MSLNWSERRSALWPDGAAMKINLGIALRALGEREGGTGKLQEAVDAHREALAPLPPAPARAAGRG
jgi:hypothetical protein